MGYTGSFSKSEFRAVIVRSRLESVFLVLCSQLIIKSFFDGFMTNHTRYAIIREFGPRYYILRTENGWRNESHAWRISSWLHYECLWSNAKKSDSEGLRPELVTSIFTSISKYVYPTRWLLVGCKLTSTTSRNIYVLSLHKGSLLGLQFWYCPSISAKFRLWNAFFTKVVFWT